MSESGRAERLHWSWIFPILTGLSILMFAQGHLTAGIGIACIVVAVSGWFMVPRAIANARYRQWERDNFYLGDRSGWYVERDGRHVATLSEPVFFDMFWESYRITPMADDPKEVARIVSDRSWWLESALAYRSIASANVVCSTFPGGEVFTETGRVVLRSTFFFVTPLDEPTG